MRVRDATRGPREHDTEFFNPFSHPSVNPLFFSRAPRSCSLFFHAREERERERVNLDLRVIKRLLSYVKRKRGGGEGGKKRKRQRERKDSSPSYVRALFLHDELYAPADLILRTVPERL